VRAPLNMVALVLAIALPQLGATKEKSWDNLKHVTRHRTYTVLARDLTCVTGRIASVAADSICVKPANGAVTRLKRMNVLRVTSDSGSIIFSGRSSWSDVKAYSSYPTESVVVTSNAGAEYKGRIMVISDSVVTVGNAIVRKSEISKLDILAYTPLSDSNEYWAEECAVTPICLLNASLWPRALGIGLRMRVRLYDASLPEDNGAVICKSQL